MTRGMASGEAAYEKGKKVSLAAFQDKAKVENFFSSVNCFFFSM